MFYTLTLMNTKKKYKKKGNEIKLIYIAHTTTY